MLKIIRTFLILIGSVLIIDCVALMAVSKINFGTVVPCLVGIIFLLHGIYWPPIQQWLAGKRWLKRLWTLCWGGFVLWLLSFGVFIGLLQQQIQQSKGLQAPVAAIIVLGAGTVEGKPTPTLAARLDAAVPLLNAQPQAVVVTSGGIGLGRTRSEADIMASYLQETHGVPLARVQQEGKSTSTEENLINTKAILAAYDIALTDPIAIVTSDFHTIRSAAIAHHQGYTQPIMIASPTPLSIRYNAWFREYFAFISGWLLGEY